MMSMKGKIDYAPSDSIIRINILHNISEIPKNEMVIDTEGRERSLFHNDSHPKVVISPKRGLILGLILQRSPS